MYFGDSPDVATANACVAATELMRRRDDRDEVTTTPGRTFFNEPSAALRRLCRGEERTSLRRLARRINVFERFVFLILLQSQRTFCDVV